MPKDITCADCSALRRNAAYSNTRYCVSCRLLRDLSFIKDQVRTCSRAACSRRFAPVSRRDSYCGPCGFGSPDEGHCWYCKNDHAELHRAGLAVCVNCIRDPAKRITILGALRRGQADRRLQNGHRA